MFTLAGLKKIKEVFKTVMYMESESENKSTKKNTGLSCNKKTFFTLSNMIFIEIFDKAKSRKCLKCVYKKCHLHSKWNILKS